MDSTVELEAYTRRLYGNYGVLTVVPSAFLPFLWSLIFDVFWNGVDSGSQRVRIRQDISVPVR